MKNNQKIIPLYEDEDIIVINKPAGILTIPDRYDKAAPNLRSILINKYPNIFVVHRLDKETSGVIVFAKNAEAHKNLNTQFQELEVTKIYHVITSGIITEDELKIDIPLLPDPSIKGKMKPSARGKDSLTILNVIKRYRIATLAKCQLITGRHHQIRVHCSSLGYPLLIDEMYGRTGQFFLSTVKKRYNLQKNSIEKPIISRVTMHAFTISFKHPLSGELITFEADYPKDFSALLQVLDKYCSIPSFNNI